MQKGSVVCYSDKWQVSGALCAAYFLLITVASPSIDLGR